MKKTSEERRLYKYIKRNITRNHEITESLCRALLTELEWYDDEIKHIYLCFNSYGYDITWKQKDTIDMLRSNAMYSRKDDDNDFDSEAIDDFDLPF